MDKLFHNRSIIGLLLLSIISFTYYYNFDLFFFSILIFFVFYEIFKNKFLNNLFFLFFLLNYFLISFILINFNNLFYFIILISILCLLFSLFLRNFAYILFPYFILLFLCIFFFMMINDRDIFYLIIYLSFLNDTSAYIFGKFFKGPKISKKISPNKTWSGTLGSIIISSSVLFYLDFNLFNSILISILFFYGDLYFSYIKRIFSIKDFSSILSSHGGVLDRLDSITISSIYIFLISFSNV